MLELSRQKLKEDLYNVGAFAIETYGALQIQVTQAPMAFPQSIEWACC